MITPETMLEDTLSRTWIIKDPAEHATVFINVLPQGEVEAGMLVR